MWSLGVLAVCVGSVLCATQELQIQQNQIAENLDNQRNQLEETAHKLKTIREVTYDRKEALGGEVTKAVMIGSVVGALLATPLALATGPLGLAVVAAYSGVFAYDGVQGVYKDDRKQEQEEKQYMRENLYEFQKYIKGIRLSMKFVKKHFTQQQLDTTKLVRMEQLINEMIKEINGAFSFQSLLKATGKCQEDYNELVDLLEDVWVEISPQVPQMEN